MRHRAKNNSSFNLKSGPRKALLKGLVNALIENERIRTTLPRARVVRSLVEKAITLGGKGSLAAHRLLLARFNNQKNVSKIMKDLAPRFKERPGGYTRIVKLGNRPGDHAPKALIEFVDYKFTPALTDEEKQKQKATPEYRKERRTLFKKIETKRKKVRRIKADSRNFNR